MDSVTRQITNTVFYQIQVSMRGIHLAILARSRKRYVYLVCTFLYNNYILLSHGCHFQARYIQANIWNVVIENSIVNDFQFFIICSRIIFSFPPSYRLCVSAKFKMNYLQKKIICFYLFVIETATVHSNETCCSCKLMNQTTDDLMAQRKQELTVDSKALSSTIRKQTCASDFRVSSNVIGAFGVLVFIAVTLVIVLPDLYTAAIFINRKINKFKKKQRRLMLHQQLSK